jgi:hypothetical protein
MVATLFANVLAVTWEPELRGILTVILGTVVWMGSIYLILGTNLGARLGFIVALAGFFGWMALMGGIWWIYGIGLKGDDASWQPVAGSTVIQDVQLLHEAGVISEPIEITDAESSAEAAERLRAQITGEGWSEVDPSAPEFGQAQASAEVFLIEEGAFAAGEYAVTRVFEINPPAESAFPKLGPNGEFDWIAFWHEPYYTVVEVAPYEETLTEPGRAPVTPQVDEEQPRQYVYMIRDLGSLREPAAMITIGSTVIFLGLCWLLHRRDRFVAENLARKAAVA